MGMREILFRGKQEFNEWSEGSLIIWQDGSCAIEPGSLTEPMASVDPETVGQFTGLTDKNGKKVFEGDVVQYFGTYPLEVFIENGHAKFRFYDTYSKRQYEELFFGHDEEYGKCEVIGNIHDNPELLNGGNEE